MCYRGKPRFYISLYKFNSTEIMVACSSGKQSFKLKTFVYFKRLTGIIQSCTATKHWKQTFHA